MLACMLARHSGRKRLSIARHPGVIAWEQLAPRVVNASAPARHRGDARCHMAIALLPTVIAPAAVIARAKASEAGPHS